MSFGPSPDMGGNITAFSPCVEGACGGEGIMVQPSPSGTYPDSAARSIKSGSPTSNSKSKPAPTKGKPPPACDGDEPRCRS